MNGMASLDALKSMLQIKNTNDDAELEMSLDSASTWVCKRVIDGHELNPDVQQAILLLSARLWKRRQSPEGVAGWGDLGVIRILRSDPDITSLLSHHLDMGGGSYGLA